MIVLFTNGLIEQIKPEKLIFSEQELVNQFKEYEVIKTYRLTEVVNTWCVYGSNVIPDLTNHNKIASELIKDDIFSNTLFIHDSEINPNWKMTDDIIYKSYSEFEYDIKKLINALADKIIKEMNESDEMSGHSIIFPYLEMIGPTIDKRILFSFNPVDQPKEFFENEEFYMFSQKVYDYISSNKQVKEPFTIYEDKKAIIIVETRNVKTFLDSLIDKFKGKEEYEICTNITNLFKDWNKNIKKRTKKK